MQTTYKIQLDEEGQEYIPVSKTGMDLLRDAVLSKGTAFTEDERTEFLLHGLLPPHVSTMDEQLQRIHEGFNRAETPILKYIHLRSLQDRNEHLFYAFIMHDLEETIPIVYTPTVGTAVEEYSHIFRRPRGLFLSPQNIDRIDEILQNLPYPNIEMIVVTDSEAILGLGDQGIGGMGIPIGKLAIYVVGAGIHPTACLPITLDVGTNNEKLLSDPIYLGIRNKRLRGEKYFAFIDAFIQGIKRNLPNAIIQWEDFSKQNAFTVLDKYRNEITSFNDDIQGTGAMALAGTLSALKILKSGDFSYKLKDQVFVIFGAGAGGIGIAQRLYAGLLKAGLSEAEAKARIYTLDSRGLVVDDRENLEDYKKQFAVRREQITNWKLTHPDRIELLDVIVNAKPTVLYGTSATAGAFGEVIIKSMQKYTPVPIIFPLSNPNKNAEANPSDIYQWTNGNAIVATGSPFLDLEFMDRPIKVGQGNNAFIFPGVGLGALAAGASTITDDMFTAAAFALHEATPKENLACNCVFPAIRQLREVSKAVALAVAEAAIKNGVARRNPPLLKGGKREDLQTEIEARMWLPRYVRYRRIG
ncbi:NAD-dependent malic enzyme [Candidatus Poribacteria bacterium]|nr:NAD-dependent malic enzyme [Candidatus Poribacteria bacterium]